MPLGGGLSSSHALECGVALAVNDIFGLGLGTRELALLTQRAENDFVGAPTGLMDQLASLGCTSGHALFLDTRSLESEHVPLDPSDLRQGMAGLGGAGAAQTWRFVGDFKTLGCSIGPV